MGAFSLKRLLFVLRASWLNIVGSCGIAILLSVLINSFAGVSSLPTLLGATIAALAAAACSIWLAYRRGVGSHLDH